MIKSQNTVAPWLLTTTIIVRLWLLTDKMAGTWIGTSTLCLHTEECRDELEDDDNEEQHSAVSLNNI
jgi:hypothetical protein